MQPQSNQYDFIMNPGKPPKKGALVNNNSIATRIAVIVGLVVVILIFFIIVLSLLSSSGGSNTKLTTIAQQQNEIIRVATLANNSGSTQTSQTTNDFSQNCLLSITTAQQQLLAYLSAHGTKLGTKQLALTKNASTDAAITAAVASSNLDAVYTSIMKTELQAYENAVKDAYGGAKSTAEKQLLSNEYSGAVLLLQQLGS